MISSSALPSNSKKYNFEDFTEEHYTWLLQETKKKWKFISYDDALSCTSDHVLWRHDVDMSVHRALALAKLENNAGVIATYFIMLHCDFYNTLEKEILDKIKEIKFLGHEIALHFDPGFYLHDGQYTEDIEEAIIKEKTILENLLQTEIKTFSFHNPENLSTIDMTSLKLGGLLNVYAKEIQDKYFYTSDSNGYWRFHRLADIINKKEHCYMQVLTHPEWWSPTPMSPEERMLRAVNGRKQSILNNYETQIKKCNRENIK